MVFKTNTGCIYYVDTENKIISGGVFDVPCQFLCLTAYVGSMAQVNLLDGSAIQLGVVV